MEIRAKQTEQFRSGILPLPDGTKLAFYNLGDDRPTLVKVRPDINSPKDKYGVLEFVFVTPVKIVETD